MLTGIVYGLSNVIIRCGIDAMLYSLGCYIKDKISGKVKKRR